MPPRLLRKAPNSLTPVSRRTTTTRTRLQRPPHRRPISSSTARLSKPETSTTSSTTAPTQSKDPRSRFRALNARFPRFIQRWTTPLLNAPVTHITSFLILHEITAVVPLFGLVAAFHYGGWMPELGISDSNAARAGEHGGAAQNKTQNRFAESFDQGVKRFGRYLKRKGWVGEEDVDAANAVRHYSSGTTADAKSTRIAVREQQGVRLVLEFATAYAITKVLLPVRIALSVWATPWFARVVLGPAGRGVRRALGR